MGKWTKKKGPQDGISDQKLLIDCEHRCICIVDDQQRWQRLMQLTQWSSAVPWTGTFHRQFQWPNTIHGLWCLCEDSKPKSIITDCQPLSRCFKEHVYISEGHMSTYEIPCISKLILKLYQLKGEKKRALLILFEISASHTWREIPRRKKQKTNMSKQICGFNCVRNANVHHSCTAEQVHSNIPPASSPSVSPSLSSPLSVSLLLSHWCLGRWGRDPGLL